MKVDIDRVDGILSEAVKLNAHWPWCASCGETNPPDGFVPVRNIPGLSDNIICGECAKAVRRVVMRRLGAPC